MGDDNLEQDSIGEVLKVIFETIEEYYEEIFYDDTEEQREWKNIICFTSGNTIQSWKGIGYEYTK